MKLTLKRIAKRKDYTIGRLYIDGVYFCDTLEDTVRDLGPKGEGKKAGRTAIGAGIYDVIVNMSPKFRRLLPRLLNVPFFSGILIHSGTNHTHTSGCILVGRNTIVGALTSSRGTSDALTSILIEAQNRGEKITIEIS